MKKKEWLVKHGHLPAGSENKRGRISAEHVALLEEAVAKLQQAPAPSELVEAPIDLDALAEQIVAKLSNRMQS